jgi:microcystin-dependent protein
MDAYLGEIRIFCGTFAPQGWAFCEGQILPISAYSTIFSLFGTTYGGDGKTTFGLPDLRGSVPLGVGQGAGLSDYQWGEKAGSPSYIAPVPPHSHPFYGTTVLASQTTVQGGVFGSAGGRAPLDRYSDGSANTTLTATTISVTPQTGATPVSDMQPYLPLNFIVCLTEGVYPVRG